MQFEEFAQRHVHDLISLGMVVTGRQADAEDFAQEALAHIYCGWAKVDAAEHPWAYARRTAMNAYLSGTRRRRVREVLGASTVDDCVAVEPTLESSVDELLDELISTLPPRQRAVLTLRYFEDLDVADISRELGIGRSSVRSSLARALASLREPLALLLAKDGGFT